jgi:hypothetical protein
LNALAGVSTAPRKAPVVGVPKTSKNAAAATAAFRVLDSLFSATHHATLLTAYNESLDAIQDGKRKDQGIAVGEKAAAKMLAEGHDGRAGQFGCAFVTPSPGVCPASRRGQPFRADAARRGSPAWANRSRLGSKRTVGATARKPRATRPCLFRDHGCDFMTAWRS